MSSCLFGGGVRRLRGVGAAHVGARAVGGYDLLNEPLPSQFSQFYSQLRPLRQRVGKAIRGIGSHHLLIVEGGNWSNDWSTRTLDSPFATTWHMAFTNIGMVPI